MILHVFFQILLVIAFVKRKFHFAQAKICAIVMTYARIAKIICAFTGRKMENVHMEKGENNGSE